MRSSRRSRLGKQTVCTHYEPFSAVSSVIGDVLIPGWNSQCLWPSLWRNKPIFTFCCWCWCCCCCGSCRVSPFLPQCTVTQMIHSNLIPSIIIFSSSFVIQRYILWLHHTVVYTTFIYLFIHVLYTHRRTTHVCTDLIQDVCCLITSKNPSMTRTSPTLLLLLLSSRRCCCYHADTKYFFSYFFCYVTLTLFTDSHFV